MVSQCTCHSVLSHQGLQRLSIIIMALLEPLDEHLHVFVGLGDFVLEVLIGDKGDEPHQVVAGLLDVVDLDGRDGQANCEDVGAVLLGDATKIPGQGMDITGLLMEGGMVKYKLT